MTLYACYATTGREFDVQESCEALGITCHVPRRVDLIRQGYRRRPDAITSPYLPNYVFPEVDEAGYYELDAIRHLARTKVEISRPAPVLAFIARVETDYAERIAQIEAGYRVSEYSPGDLLQIMAGPMAGTLASFRRIIERGQDQFPMIEAETEIMGRAVTIRVDPIRARAATG